MQIQIDNLTSNKLKKFKTMKIRTYDDVINALIDYYLENEQDVDLESKQKKGEKLVMRTSI